MKSFAVLSAYDISEYSFKKLESGIIPFEASFRAAAAFPDCKKIIILTSASCEASIVSILKNIKSDELKIEWKVKVLEKISPQAIFSEAAKEAEAESSGFENIFFLHGDEPFIDLNATEKLFKQHLEYRAEYSFADGYPEGLIPEILTSGLCPILAKLSENETSFERSFIFDTIKKEINSYDIETMIAPFDLRHLRLRFAADSKRNALLCSRFTGINAENYAELIEEKKVELFTLPAYYGIEINSSYPLKSIYKPNEVLGLVEKKEMDKAALFSLIEKIAEYSDDAVISLSVFGEPSMYQDCLSLIEKILSFPKLSVLIETCGLYWPSSFIERLEKIIASAPKRKNKMLPVYWIVCIDAVSSGMYAKVHGLSEDEANIKLKQALTFTDSLKKVFPDAVWAQIMRIKENEIEVEPFYRFWKNLGVNVIIQKYDTFCKLLEDKRVADLSPFNRHPCWHLKRDMYILADGSVPLCKEDVKRNNILGNAFSDSLDSIRKKHSRYIRSIWNADTEICAEPAMNTIPTIFNERKISYTVLGKSSGDFKAPVSVLVLNRGARYYLSSLFQNLIDLGFNSIVFVDSSKRGFEVEALSSQFPEVKFLLPLEKVTAGEMINLGISEVSSDYVMVLWNDMALSSSASPETVIDTLTQSDVICVAPVLIDEKNALIPVQIVPSLTRRDFSTEQFLCRKDLTHTIYMYDFAGIYNREKFIEMGGFDYTIENPYWQNLDFGFRAHLWGMEILISNLYKMKYAGACPLEDISADDSYIKFYLKNLAPIVGKKGGGLPWYLFFSYAIRSGLNPFKAYKYFKAVQDWVHINKYRFVKSPQDLICKWEPSI